MAPWIHMFWRACATNECKGPHLTWNSKILKLLHWCTVDCGSWWWHPASILWCTRAKTTFSSSTTSGGGKTGKLFAAAKPPPPAMPLLLNGCALGRLSFLHWVFSSVLLVVCWAASGAQYWAVVQCGRVVWRAANNWDQFEINFSGVKTTDMVHIWNNNVRFCDLLRLKTRLRVLKGVLLQFDKFFLLYYRSEWSGKNLLIVMWSVWCFW